VSRWTARSASHERLERELTGERVAALRRIVERLEALLAELEQHRAAWAAASGKGRAAVAEAHRATRGRARLYRWYLEVQRAALGLRRHDELDGCHPVPGTLDR
jgi:hypothetical protein